MVDWGLDLAQLYDPASSSTAWLNQYFGPSEADENLQLIHRLALSKDAYGVFADAWLQDPDSGHLRFSFGLMGDILRAYLCRNHKAMQLMLPHLRPDHYSLPAKDRLLFFHFLAYPPNADSLKFILRRDGNLSPEDVRELDQNGIPLIKLMAWYYKDNHSDIGLREWRKLTQDIIRTTTLLHGETKRDGLWPSCHPVFMTSMTTLQLVLIGDCCAFYHFANPPTFSKWRGATERAVLHWLEDLEACGVDLNKYGEIEKRVISESDKERSRLGMNMLDFCCLERTWRLENFIYGPKPGDWQLSWDLGIEVLHGEFWDMVENPPLHIVGAWVDDSGEED